jgi:response regulator RpfG family c-di-GMP phosphodiesterase
MNETSPSHTILVVDDEESERQILNDTLVKEGFTVLLANDGEAGLQLALNNHPDLILLDVMMPRMDGMTMLGKLRENPWGKDIPVLLLTNLSDFDQFKNAIESGVHDYLIKSDWKLEEITRKIRDKLGITK